MEKVIIELLGIFHIVIGIPSRSAIFLLENVLIFKKQQLKRTSVQQLNRAEVFIKVSGIYSRNSIFV